MLQDLVQGFFSIFRTYPTEERRRFVRLPCRYAVYCMDRRKAHEAVVSDIGPYGLRLDMVHRLSIGQKVNLVYRGVPGGSLTRLPFKKLQEVESKMPCKVLWVKRHTDNYQAGVVFQLQGEELAQTWVKPVLEKMGLSKGAFTQKRSLIRARALLDAEVRHEGTAVEGLLVNVGLGGALFQSKQHLNPGIKVTLTVNPKGKLPPLQVTGQIIHHNFDVVSNSGMHSIQFKDLDQSGEATLKSYVIHLLRTVGSG